MLVISLLRTHLTIQLNILDSRNIATTNVKVFSYDGNNGDGLGYGCSQNVICWGNFTDTGDDNLGFGSSVGSGCKRFRNPDKLRSMDV